jgi:Asp-tRNA(Asn)/Glu-tRNA(Gln) amidotransferase A subunit family amidase
LSDRDLLWASAVEQARHVRDKQVSSAELTALVLDRVDEVDGEVAAFVTIDADGARAAAAAADAATARGEGAGPLHGVPFTVKDLLDTAGLRTTFGSRLYADNVPAADAASVARMRSAGAVLIGKVNTPEFGLAAETYNDVSRRTNNPWSLDRTTGGSSGGSAAAVAAGMGAVSLGTDAGGSIRLPSSWCGVFGLKPTYGRVPTNPKTIRANHPTETAGPIARHVEDIAATLDVIAGHDVRDPSSLRMPITPAVDAVHDLDSPLRVRFGLDLGMGVADDDVNKAILSALDALSATGAEVEESTLDVGTPHPFLVMFDLIAGWASEHFAYAEPRFDDLMDYSQTFIDTGRKLSAGDYVRAVHDAKAVGVRVDEELARCDVLAFPVTAVVAWPHGQPPELVGGKPPSAFGGITYGGLPYLALANITGHPAMSVPVGLDGAGMPIAVQLVGRHFDERTVLRAAARVAAAQPFTSHPVL